MVDFSTIIPSPAGRGDRLRKTDCENLIKVDFQRHYSLSPWERVRERVKNVKAQETSSEKDGNMKLALPKRKT